MSDYDYYSTWNMAAANEARAREEEQARRARWEQEERDRESARQREEEQRRQREEETRRQKERDDAAYSQQQDYLRRVEEERLARIHQEALADRAQNRSFPETAAQRVREEEPAPGYVFIPEVIDSSSSAGAFKSSERGAYDSFFATITMEKVLLTAADLLIDWVRFFWVCLLIVVALGKLFDIVGMFLTPEQPPGTYSTPIICQGLLCLAVLFLIPTISAAMLHQLAVNTGPWAVSVFYTMLLITILFVFRGIIARYTAWRESIQDKPWRMRFLLTKLLPSAVIFGYVVLIMVAN